MRWIQKQKPSHGDKKVRVVFAFLPHSVNRTTMGKTIYWAMVNTCVWLELIEKHYVYRSDWRNWEFDHWELYNGNGGE